MDTLELSEERIMTVWGWCSKAYLQYGFRLQFPARTNPTKTYQWRYVRAITIKFDEWDFDESTAIRFIEIAVAHAHEAGVLRKGLAALHQANMLGVCYEKLQAQSDTNRQILDSLRHIQKWLTAKSGNDILEALLYRNDVDELCNLVQWVQASRISPLYLALSRSCGKALARLAMSHAEERKFLPKTTTLYMLRSDFLEDATNVEQAKRIFGPDWRKLCL